MFLWNLHAPQILSVNEFFNVHFPQDQNSPFFNVVSSILEILRSFDPPHAAHANAVGALTKVHFLHVQSLSCIVFAEKSEEMSI